MTVRSLGRLVPSDFDHVDKYPMRRLAAPPAVCERTIGLSSTWRRIYDQGATSMCVGYSSSQERSLSERITFDPIWLYRQCKNRDSIPNEDGTYLRVAYDVLRDIGPVPIIGGKASQPDPALGVERNEWARSITDIRAAIQAGKVCVMGSNWYERMFEPVKRGTMYWLPEGTADLGRLAGGHAYALNRVSDRYEAFGTPNSWGLSDRDWHPNERGWPVTMIPYSLIERLLAEDGECVLVIDRKDIMP